MAYKKKDLYQKAMTAIEENELLFIEDVIAYLPCSKSTFYEYFPAESDELDALKEKLNENRTVLKVDLRKKWKDSENPTLQLALYKLISTNQERKKLDTKYNENSEEEDSENKKNTTDYHVYFHDYSNKNKE